MNGRPFPTCVRLGLASALVAAAFAVVLPSTAVAAERVVLVEELMATW